MKQMSSIMLNQIFIIHSAFLLIANWSNIFGWEKISRKWTLIYHNNGPCFVILCAYISIWFNSVYLCVGLSVMACHSKFYLAILTLNELKIAVIYGQLMCFYWIIIAHFAMKTTMFIRSVYIAFYANYDWISQFFFICHEQSNQFRIKQGKFHVNQARSSDPESISYEQFLLKLTEKSYFQVIFHHSPFEFMIHHFFSFVLKLI